MLKNIIYIGSDDSCDVVEKNPGVSAKHCLIRRDSSSKKNRFFLKDNNSTNGTFFKGKRLEKNESVEIPFAAIIELGLETSIIFQLSFFIKKKKAPIPLQVSISFGYNKNNDFVINEDIISGYHARITKDVEGKHLLEDIDSRNGVWYDGQKIKSIEISLNDTFSLGSHSVEFNAEMSGLLSQKQKTATELRKEINELKRKPIIIGRDDVCDITIPESSVSRKHCSILPLKKGFRVQNLSDNGLWLGQPNNKIQEAIANYDDILYLGNYKLHLNQIPRLLQRARQMKPSVKIDFTEISSSFFIGKSNENDFRIEDNNISQKHAEIRQTNNVLNIRDLNSTNGIFINTVRVPSNEWVVLHLDDTLLFGNLRIDFNRSEKEVLGEIALQAKNLSVVVKNTKTKKPFTLLNDINFTIHPGEFVGLMGPSGSGKTTLLTALNGYQKPTSGTSFLNEHNIYEQYDLFRGNIGYVPQNDIIFTQLTVYEALYYTAKLRLPSDTLEDDIDQKINQILEKLNIQNTRDVVIGDALTKGISGGQRKRVNLAHELITEPALLFLDEPTSGLSSEDTFSVMELLQELSDNGTTIILTIHQPSLRIYKKMKSIIYLFNGRQVYYGPSEEAILFFHPEAKTENEKKSLLSDPSNALKPLTDDQKTIDRAETKERKLELLDEIIRKRVTAYQESPFYKRLVVEREETSCKQISVGSKQKIKRKGVFRQFWILTKRAFVILRKEKIRVFVSQPLVIALALVLVFAGKLDLVGEYFETLIRGPSALFLLVISSVWFGASNSAQSIVSERAIYKRERMVNLMIPSYVFSKVFILMALSSLQILLLLGIVYFPLRFEGSFLTMYFGLVLSAGVGVGMGLVLSAFSKTEKSAVAAVPIILIPQIIFGGVMLPIYEIADAGKIVSNVMAVRWGHEILMHVEYDDQDVDDFREHCGIDEVSDDSIQNECNWDSNFEMYRLLDEEIEDNRICGGFCEALRQSLPLSPMDHSFGVVVDDDDDGHNNLREQAREDTTESFIEPKKNVRVSIELNFIWLIAFNILLTLFVMALLKFRDVDVE